MSEDELRAIEARATALTEACTTGDQAGLPLADRVRTIRYAFNDDRSLSVVDLARRVHVQRQSADDVPALVAEVRRLRGLIKRVEWERQGDPHWTQCPWGCIVQTNWDASEDLDGRPTGDHGYRHAADCPAFTPDGTVR